MIKYFNIITIAVLLVAAMVVDYDVGQSYIMAVDPLVGSAIVGGLGSLFGNIFSTQSANEANVALSRENRDWQTKENQLNRDFTSSQNQMSRDWQEKMWNAQNQYNTPSAMMDRYRAAGLNPFLLGGNSPTVGAAGSPGSPSQGSPSMVGAPNSATVQSLPFGNALSMVGQLIQAKGVSANAANQSAQSLKTLTDAMQEIKKNFGTGAAKSFGEKYLPMFVPDFKNNDYMKTLEYEWKRMDIANQMNDLHLQIEERFGYQKAERALEIMQKQSFKLDSEIDNIDMQSEKFLYEMNELFTRAAQNIAHAANLEADTKTINGIRKSLIDLYEYNAESAGYSTAEQGAEFENTALYREWLKSPYAKRKRMQAEMGMNPKFNERVSKIQRFTRALGLGGSINYSLPNGNGSTINYINK